MSEPNTLMALQKLWLSRPGPDAAPMVVAGWYVRKARMLELLAAAGSELAAPQARAAYRHAQALTAGTQGSNASDPGEYAPVAVSSDHWAGTEHVSVRTEGRS